MPARGEGAPMPWLRGLASIPDPASPIRMEHRARLSAAEREIERDPSSLHQSDGSVGWSCQEVEYDL